MLYLHHESCKQKLCETVSRNGSALTQARLQAVQNCGAVHHEGREKHERSASLNLLLRFQRLLIAQIYCHSHKMKSWNSQQGKVLCIFEKYMLWLFVDRRVHIHNHSSSICRIYLTTGANIILSCKSYTISSKA